MLPTNRTKIYNGLSDSKGNVDKIRNNVIKLLPGSTKCDTKVLIEGLTHIINLGFETKNKIKQYGNHLSANGAIKQLVVAVLNEVLNTPSTRATASSTKTTPAKQALTTTSQTPLSVDNSKVTMVSQDQATEDFKKIVATNCSLLPTKDKAKFKNVTWDKITTLPVVDVKIAKLIDQIVLYQNKLKASGKVYDDEYTQKIIDLYREIIHYCSKVMRNGNLDTDYYAAVALEYSIRVLKEVKFVINYFNDQDLEEQLGKNMKDYEASKKLYLDLLYSNKRYFVIKLNDIILTKYMIPFYIDENAKYLTIKIDDEIEIHRGITQTWQYQYEIFNTTLEKLIHVESITQTELLKSKFEIKDILLTFSKISEWSKQLHLACIRKFVDNDNCEELRDLLSQQGLLNKPFILNEINAYHHLSEERLVCLVAYLKLALLESNAKFSHLIEHDEAATLLFDYACETILLNQLTKINGKQVLCIYHLMIDLCSTTLQQVEQLCSDSDYTNLSHTKNLLNKLTELFAKTKKIFNISRQLNHTDQQQLTILMNLKKGIDQACKTLAEKNEKQKIFADTFLAEEECCLQQERLRLMANYSKKKAIVNNKNSSNALCNFEDESEIDLAYHTSLDDETSVIENLFATYRHYRFAKNYSSALAELANISQTIANHQSDHDIGTIVLETSYAELYHAYADDLVSSLNVFSMERGNIEQLNQYVQTAAVHLQRSLEIINTLPQGRHETFIKTHDFLLTLNTALQNQVEFYKKSLQQLTAQAPINELAKTTKNIGALSAQEVGNISTPATTLPFIAPLKASLPPSVIRVPVPHQLMELTAFFSSLGLKTIVFGGFFRNLLLGTLMNDIDIKVIGKGDFTLWLNTFKDHLVVNIHRPNTYTLSYNGIEFDIEWVPDGDATVICDHLRQHADCSANAIAEILETGSSFIDIRNMDAVIDICNKVIRTHDVSHCLQEDPIRLLRWLRFANQLGFKLPEQVLEKKAHYAELLHQVPHHEMGRINSEVKKTCLFGHGCQAIKLLMEFKIIQQIFPLTQKSFDEHILFKNWLIKHMEKLDMNFHYNKQRNSSLQFYALLLAGYAVPLFTQALATKSSATGVVVTLFKELEDLDFIKNYFSAEQMDAIKFHLTQNLNDLAKVFRDSAYLAVAAATVNPSNVLAIPTNKTVNTATTPSSIIPTTTPTTMVASVAAHSFLNVAKENPNVSASAPPPSYKNG